MLRYRYLFGCPHLSITFLPYDSEFSPFFLMVVTSEQMKEADPRCRRPLCGPFTVETGCEMLMVAASAPPTTQTPTPPTRNVCMFWKVGRSKHPQHQTKIHFSFYKTWRSGPPAACEQTSASLSFAPSEDRAAV